MSQMKKKIAHVTHIDIELFTLQKNVSNIRLHECVSTVLRHVSGTVAAESSRI